MQQLVADAQSSFAQELKDAVAQVREEASTGAEQQTEVQTAAQREEVLRKQVRDSREAEAVQLAPEVEVDLSLSRKLCSWNWRRHKWRSRLQRLRRESRLSSVSSMLNELSEKQKHKLRGTECSNWWQMPRAHSPRSSRMQ